MKVAFTKPGLPKSGTLAVGVLEGGILTPSAAAADAALSGGIARAVAASRFSGKAEQTLALVAPAGLALERLVLVGLGKEAEITPRAMETFGAAAVTAAAAARSGALTLAVDVMKEAKASTAMLAAHAALGAGLRDYRFDKYHTKKKPEDGSALAALTVAVKDPAAAEAAFAPLGESLKGVSLTRDLVSEPANVMSPDAMVKAAKSLAKLGVEVEVLDEKEMRKLGMGALLGVAQGSARAPHLVVLRWNGGAKDEAPLAVVGKGVCFDSGGISIKPSAGMEEMKTDMAGSAVVAGLMETLARRKARANVVGIMGLVENMPSGTAQRPGDVVTSMSGQTIEVVNTDAEGRLVLADALWYVQDRFKPRAVVDLATLTGAMVVALGTFRAGLFCNDDALADGLLAAGEAVGEPLWRMPLGPEYDEMIDSDVADVKNSGVRDAGSITAAQFLKRFVKEGQAWAHLDIAGVAWLKKARATSPKGASGFGVRLLDQLIADAVESPAVKTKGKPAKKK